MMWCLLEQASANWNMYYKEMACKGGARERGHFLERGKAVFRYLGRSVLALIGQCYHINKPSMHLTNLFDFQGKNRKNYWVCTR